MLGRGLCPKPVPDATLALLTTSALLLVSVHLSESLLCGSCNPVSCTNLVDCPKGVTTDLCGCCEVCSKQENDTCGGQHGLLGRCAPGLECFISPKIGQAITGHEEGVCREVGTSNCANVNCDEPVVSQCPPDSILIRNMSLMVISACCKPPLACECNVGACVRRACPVGYESVLVKEGLGKPGSCCHQYRCERSEKCRSVTCPEEVELSCSEDAYRPPNVATADGCCNQQQGCKCKSDQCPLVECPDHYQIEVISKAMDKPGFCCDKFSCVNDTAQGCDYQEKRYKDGEKWHLDKCTRCTCRDGLTFCQAETCSTPLCGWMLVPEGECCPVCKGCVSDSGRLYNNSEMWKENNCVTCHCDGGQALCQAEMCAVPCQNPRYIPGHCCPICDGESSLITQPDYCPVITNCSHLCPGGLQRNAKGCYLCKCKPGCYLCKCKPGKNYPDYCPDITAVTSVQVDKQRNAIGCYLCKCNLKNCELECKYGYVVEETGEEVCECTKPPHHCSRLDSCKKECIYGYKKARSGCLKCRCNKCPPFNCTKRCIHGYFFNDQGCTICKCQEAPETHKTSLSPVFHKTTMTTNSPIVSLDGPSCLSMSGIRHDDGESWHDGCRRCYCHNGKEMCSLITCPSPRCTNPVFRVGDCCPSCPDLDVPELSGVGAQEKCVAVSGNHYAEGETWHLDECTQCICHGGGVLCETHTCPPMLCRFPIKHQDRCCPVCPGGETFPTSPGSGSCSTPSGKGYDHGDVWQPSPCQSCVCKYGQIHCFSQMCPPATCNKTVLRKGHCCPGCLEGTVTALCSHSGLTYSAGEQWQEDNCTICQCEHGEVMCHQIMCPTLRCTIMVRKPSDCCPVCLNDTTYTIPKVHLLPPASNEVEVIPVHLEKEDMPEEAGRDNNYLVAIGVLGVMVFLFLLLSVILVWVVMRQRRSGTFKTNMDHNMLTDIKIRPKSTNLDLQGAMPFLYDPTLQAKTFNCGKMSSEVTPLTGNNETKMAADQAEMSLLGSDDDDEIWSKLVGGNLPTENTNKLIYETYDKV